MNPLILTSAGERKILNLDLLLDALSRPPIISPEEDDQNFRRSLMEDEELDLSTPACLYLLSAFLAMEPTDCLISLARECGGGSITKGVQSFIWEQCIRRTVGKNHRPSDSYIKNFLKKVIVHVESNCDEVLDGLYEQYAYYVTSLKDDSSAKAITRVCKSISFLFPDSNLEAPSCPTSKKVVVPLRCSLNMLEGDTGCSIWPSSLFLSEFILSFPEIFSNKSCFEVGSGVGLVGISLAYVKAYKVVLSDGDLSSLANMKLNLEMNQLTASTEMSQSTIQDPYLVECKYMRWESASESELQDFRPDIVLGADVIYDPLCLPHLMRVLSILLNPRKYNSHRGKANCQGLSPEKTHVNNNGGNTDDYKIYSQYGSGNSETAADDNCHGADSCQGRAGFIDASNTESQFAATKKVPVAYIATVIRNLDTFNCFLRLAGEAHLSVVDITETQKPLDLVPYMRSYNRSSLRLLTVFFSGH